MEEEKELAEQKINYGGVAGYAENCGHTASSLTLMDIHKMLEDIRLEKLHIDFEPCHFGDKNMITYEARCYLLVVHIRKMQDKIFEVGERLKHVSGLK